MTMARLQAELEAARAELDNFTFTVSHDLRASLRHVTAYVKIIQEDLGHETSADMASHLGRVGDAARHMGQQIDGLTELSRLGRVELRPTRVDMVALLNELFLELAPPAAAQTVQWNLAPDVPALLGDAVLLRQAFRQVLANALKFSRQQSTSVVKIAWQATTADSCELTVSDNGVGFKPDYSAKLFRPFQRLHAASEFEGLGMGLALTRKIVERHGGSVSARSEAQGGCHISLTLPLAKDLLA